MKVFYCSTCFECYYVHPQKPATVCRCIVLFRCVLVYWCGSAGVGWYPNAGWSTTVLQPAFGYNRLFVFSPENCAQVRTSELVYCRGATPNSGSSTTEASSGVRLPSNASELLRDFRNLFYSQTAILENQITNCIDVNDVC
jgi:hypothetical protein